MHLRKLVSIFFLVTLGANASESSSFLSQLKQDQIEIDKKTNELESDNLKYNWIKSITGSYTHTEYDGNSKSDTYSIKLVDQPIFKSGGIYFGIKYAGANREFLRLSTKVSEQNSIKSAIASWYGIKKLDLQIKRQESLIENAKIDIIRKKEQYESGFLDSSYLDNAILTKNSLQKSLVDMQTSKYQQMMSFEALSDAEYESLEAPKFALVDEENYITNSLVLQQQDATVKKNRYDKLGTIAGYLPEISFSASYNDEKNEKNEVISSDTYNTYGFKVSMPLVDVNIARNIELRKLAYLKSQLALSDAKRAESKEYQSIAKKIEFLEKKADLALEDYKLYESLLNSTTELYNAGQKTIYDVETLKNSRETMKYDKLIYEVDIQLALLDLYAKMNGKL